MFTIIFISCNYPVFDSMATYLSHDTTVYLTFESYLVSVVDRMLLWAVKQAKRAEGEGQPQQQHEESMSGRQSTRIPLRVRDSCSFFIVIVSQCIQVHSRETVQP